MSFMTATNQPYSSILVFNSHGQVLARKDSGKYGIPSSLPKDGEDIRDAAIRVGNSCHISPTKMHPIFGHKDQDKHYTVFLVTHKSNTPQPLPTEAGCEWVHPWDLCMEDKSTNPEFYKQLFSLIFKKVIPAVVV